MRNTGIWIWFNGYRAFVYGQLTGRVCEDKSYSPAYAINIQTGQKEGYECVLSLEQLIDYYKKNGGNMKYIYTRVEDREKYDVYAVLNMMRSKKIIVF